MAVTDTTQKETFHHWTLPPRGEGREIVYTEKFPELMADLFAVLPLRGVGGVRLYSRQLNYADLLGDDNPAARHNSNARLDALYRLLASIQSHATQLYFPSEAEARMGKAARDQCRPGDSLAEFEAFNRWLLQRTCAKG